MKRLKAGPELKMPELKVPTFLVDLYWDLRERHLLPLVGLAIVAIVAVPFLLSGGSEKESGPISRGVASAPSPEPAGSKLTVVEAKPGLRDYRRRLRGDSPTNPFKQRYTTPVLTGTKLGGGGEEASSSSSTTSTSTSTTQVTKTTNTSSGTKTTQVTTQSNGESTSGGGESSTPQLTLYSFAIDVKIVRTTSTADGGKQTSEPTVRHGVLPPAPLPGEKAQVVTYMGINPTTRLPLLLISDEVTAVFGEGKCLSGANACQLIEVEPDFPETFVFGPSGTRYKITVLKVEPVATGHS